MAKGCKIKASGTSNRDKEHLGTPPGGRAEWRIWENFAEGTLRLGLTSFADRPPFYTMGAFAASSRRCKRMLSLQPKTRLLSSEPDLCASDLEPPSKSEPAVIGLHPAPEHDTTERKKNAAVTSLQHSLLHALLHEKATRRLIWTECSCRYHSRQPSQALGVRRHARSLPPQEEV